MPIASPTLSVHNFSLKEEKVHVILPFDCCPMVILVPAIKIPSGPLITPLISSYVWIQGFEERFEILSNPSNCLNYSKGI